jgi:nucleotide-binding universal stress UspA family protein
MGKNKIENREHIIVPLDLFQSIGNQVICAIDTAMLLGAAVTIITVIEKEKLSLRPVYVRRLKELRLLLRDINIDCNSHLLTAQESVAEEILSFSVKFDSAMLLLATNNSMQANDLSIGSVARELIAKSGIPVQCVNANYACRKLVDESGNFIKAGSLSWFSLQDHLINNQYELEV